MDTYEVQKQNGKGSGPRGHASTANFHHRHIDFFNFRLVFCSMAYMFTTTATVFTGEPLPVLHSRSRPRVPIDFYVV